MIIIKPVLFFNPKNGNVSPMPHNAKIKPLTRLYRRWALNYPLYSSGVKYPYGNASIGIYEAYGIYPG